MPGNTRDVRRYDPLAVRALVVDIARAVGVNAADADLFAEALTDADLHGLPTHGVSRLEIYIRRICLGLIDPRAPLTVQETSGSVLVVDAGNGLGQVQASKVLQLLLPYARKNGVAAATIRRSNHFGSLSYYCNKAAAAEMLLFAATNAEPGMSAEGGCEPCMGTNPLAMSFPTGKGFFVKTDLATSVVARGNIIASRKRQEPIPDDWAFDIDGQPTTDAERALEGSVRPMAGHKGYALAVMVEALAGVLSGAAVGPHVGSMYKNLDRPQDVGHFFCLINIGAFIDPRDFTTQMDAFIDAIKASRRRPGVREIPIPGERSRSIAAENTARGLPIERETLRELEHLCRSLHVPFTLAERP